jgi:hypothetical protein
MYFYNYAAAMMIRHFQNDSDGFDCYERDYERVKKDTNIIDAQTRYINNNDISIISTSCYKSKIVPTIKFKPHAYIEEGVYVTGGAPVTLVENDSIGHNKGRYTRYYMRNTWLGELNIHSKVYSKVLKLGFLIISTDSLERSDICDVYVKRQDDYPINPRFAVPPNTETDMFELFKKGHYRDSTGQIPLISKSFKK